MVARRAGARSFAERADLPTSIYYAYWRGVQPYAGGEPLIVTYGTGRGYGIGLMDSADGTTCVALEGRASALELGDQKPLARYLEILRRHPRVWRRLATAEILGEVRGMRNVGNLYRDAGGPGWALAGDALHQKDPLDGQGIYDAVLTAKLLSQAILAWKHGRATWDQALDGYAAAVRAETYPMYDETMERVRRELYTDHPDWAYRTWLRWLATDREYQRRMVLLLSRGIHPTGWLPARVAAAAIGRGALADLGRLIAGRLAPRALPPRA
jgi:flavin-dependent dehydrogenase